MTQVEVSNTALSYLGIRAKIVAADEDSVEAKACLTHWAGLRDLSLRLHDWSFARVTVRLEGAAAPSEATPATPWRYRHALPADCLSLRRLNGRAVGEPDEVCEIAAEREDDGAIAAILYSDFDPADATYTARVSDVVRWDAGFADAMAWGLAARVCYELTARDDRARTLTQQWQVALALAAATAANEPSGRPTMALPEAIRVRGWR